MNGYGEGSPYCHFHPNEFVVGICALCLKERLNALALKQGRHDPLRSSTQGRKFLRAQPSRQPAWIPKVFALASLLHLLEPRYSSGQDDDGGGGDDDDKGGSIASLEDSFISIKFEGNGRATWEKKKKKKTASKEQSKKTCTTAPTTTAAAAADDDDDNNGNAVIRDRKEEVLKTMVELPKRSGGAGTLRWRKRIGHILQLTRGKRSGKVEGGGIKGSGRQRELG